MSEHTPEPWKIGDGQAPFYAWKGQILAEHEDREFILASCNQNYPDEAESNARRIVACINACRGLQTEKLEHMAEVKSDLMMKSIFTVEALDDAIRERDEARAMVKDLAEFLSAYHERTHTESTRLPGVCRTCELILKAEAML